MVIPGGLKHVRNLFWGVLDDAEEEVHGQEEGSYSAVESDIIGLNRQGHLPTVRAGILELHDNFLVSRSIVLMTPSPQRTLFAWISRHVLAGEERMNVVRLCSTRPCSGYCSRPSLIPPWFRQASRPIEISSASSTRTSKLRRNVFQPLGMPVTGEIPVTCRSSPFPMGWSRSPVTSGDLSSL